MLLVAGVAVVLSSQPPPSDFGWFAYAPLGDESGGHMSGSGSLWNESALVVARWQIVGFFVGAIGLVVLAAGMGFHLGRRRDGLDELSS